MQLETDAEHVHTQTSEHKHANGFLQTYICNKVHRLPTCVHGNSSTHANRRLQSHTSELVCVCTYTHTNTQCACACALLIPVSFSKTSLRTPFSLSGAFTPGKSQRHPETQSCLHPPSPGTGHNLSISLDLSPRGSSRGHAGPNDWGWMPRGRSP